MYHFGPVFNPKLRLHRPLVAACLRSLPLLPRTQSPTHRRQGSTLIGTKNIPWGPLHGFKIKFQGDRHFENEYDFQSV